MKSVKQFFLLIILMTFIFNCKAQKNVISLETLLDEMVSIEQLSRIPNPYYTSHQESSYDRSSVSPADPTWFANDDGYGIIRVDTIENRIEKVMFDETGPGVITRIWITAKDKKGALRFYFDGSSDPDLIILSYDLMKINVPGIGRGLLQPHTSYTSDGKGGSTLFFPIPYQKRCKITFEDDLDVKPTQKYYGINFRKYSENTIIETLSQDIIRSNKNKIIEVDSILLNPILEKKGVLISKENVIASNDSLIMQLPIGENAVYELKINISIEDACSYEQLMREIVFSASFDDKETIWVPLSDFSGGGMGAPRVKSWYLESDGNGSITSRWLMPYKKKGELKIINLSSSPLDVKIETNVSPLKWDDNSLYFHSSWRQETGIPIYPHNEPENCTEWNFATIIGKGLYMGDLLSLFNHAPRWYGEGDEKIWIDNDTFPSHFGTGTEDYYNSSWAPVIPFYTPFGGAPRADLESSHGYNAFLRTRNLDGIPFKKKFRFDIEMIGWERGNVDYATTIFWYGDYESKAIGTSGVEEAKRVLIAAPENPANYKIPKCLEIEMANISAKTQSLRVRNQSTAGFQNGKWSGASHLLIEEGKEGDYIEFIFDNLDDNQYKIQLFATKAKDYGIIDFTINDKPTKLQFDGYSNNINHVGPIILGVFKPISGKLKLKIEITGANILSKGAKYLIGLDCIQLIPLQ